MAYTSSNLIKSVMGPKNVMVFRVTADAASGTISTGWNYVQGCIGLTIRSATTTGFRTYINANAASTVCGGVVGFSGLVNGDVFDIALIGR